MAHDKEVHLSLCFIKHRPMKTYEGTKVPHLHTLMQQWNTRNQYIRKFIQYQLLNEQIPVPVICALETPGSNLRLFTFHIPGVRIKGIQNKKKYISETNCHTRIRLMSSERKTLKVFFRTWLERMRHHISATMLLITWREMVRRWIGKRWTNRLAS
jgi:hypothetical protein